MASKKTGDRDARIARERLRTYSARQSVHANRVRRRRNDNIVSIAAGLVVVVLAVVAQIAFFTAGPGAPAPVPSASPTPSATAPTGKNVGDIPSPALSENRSWTGELTLNDVALGFELDGAAAPQGVAAFLQQIDDGYFTGKDCHRLTDGGFFVLQCGSVDGTGAGDPTFSFGPIENAPADNVYAEGTIALARAGGNAYSNGHQFFIVYGDTTIPADAAGGYTVLGKITSGLDQLKAGITDKGTADGSSDGAPAVTTVITSVSLD